MRRCVWSRNLKNEEAMARVGPQRHRNKKFTNQTVINNYSLLGLKKRKETFSIQCSSIAETAVMEH